MIFSELTLNLVGRPLCWVPVGSSIEKRPDGHSVQCEEVPKQMSQRQGISMISSMPTQSCAKPGEFRVTGCVYMRWKVEIHSFHENFDFFENLSKFGVKSSTARRNLSRFENLSQMRWQFWDIFARCWGFHTEILMDFQKIEFLVKTAYLYFPTHLDTFRGSKLSGIGTRLSEHAWNHWNTLCLWHLLGCLFIWRATQSDVTDTRYSNGFSLCSHIVEPLPERFKLEGVRIRVLRSRRVAFTRTKNYPKPIISRREILSGVKKYFVAEKLVLLVENDQLLLKSLLLLEAFPTKS